VLLRRGRGWGGMEWGVYTSYNMNVEGRMGMNKLYGSLCVMCRDHHEGYCNDEEGKNQQPSQALTHNIDDCNTLISY